MELELEEPQDMRFRVQNISNQQMNLSVLLQDRADFGSDLIIQSIERGSDRLGLLEPMEAREVVLKLFGRRLGILPLTGLIIKDSVSNRDLSYKRSICSISVRQVQ